MYGGLPTSKVCNIPLQQEADWGPARGRWCQRAKQIRYETSKLAGLEVFKKATPNNYLPDDAAATTDSIITDTDALDNGGSASTPFFTLMPTTSANVSDAAQGVTVGDLEKVPRPLVNWSSLMHPKRVEADDLMSLIKLQIVQDEAFREKMSTSAWNRSAGTVKGKGKMIARKGMRRREDMTACSTWWCWRYARMTTSVPCSNDGELF